MGEVLVSTTDLSADIALLEAHGFLLGTIFPADEPRVAILHGHGVAVRFDADLVAPGPIVLLSPGIESFETSAGAEFRSRDLSFPIPELQDAFVHTTGGDWGEGRAGMYYRDLIPERHGGRFIASHIKITEPGPVPDYVHHHDIRFQMIFCRRGRVEVVYEDQGPPFWLEAGDCVLQPPNIRHRVLSSEDDCEVVEIGCPAEHPTYIDHEMILPTSQLVPDRDFGGQKFSFDRASSTPWEASEFGMWSQRATGIGTATSGMAIVRVLRNDSDLSASGTNGDELCMFFVLDGETTLVVDDVEHPLGVDDSVAIASGQTWYLTGEGNVEVLQVVVRSDQ